MATRPSSHLKGDVAEPLLTWAPVTSETLTRWLLLRHITPQFVFVYPYALLLLGSKQIKARNLNHLGMHSSFQENKTQFYFSQKTNLQSRMLHSGPPNHKGWNSVGPLTWRFFSRDIELVLCICTFVSKPTVLWNAQMWNCGYRTPTLGLEHPWILVHTGAPGINSL